MNQRESVRSVQFIDIYYPMIDGVVKTVDNYAQRMDTCVVCPRMILGYDTRRFSYDVLTCTTLRVPFADYACAVPRVDGRLGPALRKRNAELFHAHSPALLGRYALEMGKKMGIPVVATFHSKYYEALLEFTKSRLLAERLTKSIVRFYENCDAVWACSEGTAETLRSYGYHGGITVITNGTGFECPDDPKKLASEAMVRHDIPRDRHILLFVGQMVWYKNQKLLLDAYRLLCDETDNYCLVMVGTGRDEEEIRNYAETLGFTSRQIRFTGSITDREELAGIYACADLLFFPSAFDNTPLVVREAAVMGVPSLLIEGSNAAEVVENDVNGYTAEGTPGAMRDAIRNIFSDPVGLDLTGYAARETIPVQWGTLIPRVEEEYRKIIEQYQSSRNRGIA